MKPGTRYESLLLDDGRKVVLRTLGKGDLSGAIRFANALVKERSRNRGLGVLIDTRVSRLEEEDWLDKMVTGIRSGDVFNVAAFHGGNLVGNSDIHRHGFRDLRHSGTLGIAILDGYRGAGLGRRMLGHLLRAARDGGVSLVELRVLSINRPALRLYRSLGFRTAGRVPGKVIRRRRRIDEVLMFRQG